MCHCSRPQDSSRQSRHELAMALGLGAEAIAELSWPDLLDIVRNQTRFISQVHALVDGTR